MKKLKKKKKLQNEIIILFEEKYFKIFAEMWPLGERLGGNDGKVNP